MKKIETCIKCKLAINTKTDSFIELKEFNYGKHYKSVFWHKNCWREYFSSAKDHKEMMGMVRKSFRKINDKFDDGNELEVMV